MRQAVNSHHHNSEWLTIQEVALRLQVSRDTVERWITTGNLRAVDVNGRPKKQSRRSLWRISAKSLDAFLDARANSSSAPPPLPRRQHLNNVIDFIK